MKVLGGCWRVCFPKAARAHDRDADAYLEALLLAIIFQVIFPKLQLVQKRTDPERTELMGKQSTGELEDPRGPGTQLSAFT